MKKKTLLPVIVKSVPIFGVWREVINSDLEIIPQVEFYSLNPKNFSKEAFDFRIYFPGTILNTIMSKSLTLMPLSQKLIDNDFKKGTWDAWTKEYYKGIFQKAVNEEVIGKAVIFNLGDKSSNTVEPYLISKESIEASSQLN
jgi:hypothetical protein